MGGAASASAGVELAAGTRLAGRYRIEERIGRGGMGSVYRALDESGGGQLALKTLDRRVAASDALIEALFEREYRTLCQLEHPHVVRVFDFGVHEGDGASPPTPFYTMELLPGEELRKQLPLPWQRACAIARDVCSALALLHSRRLLHRDVGIRNVRCDAEGRARLFDFGAMVPMGPARDLVGTPPAVPPEALRGQQLDGRSDLYAVGAMLYHALTGRHAYPARRLRDLERVWKRTPAGVAALAPDVPAALDELVFALLSSDPGARPSAAGEVIEHLNALAGLPEVDPVAATRAYLITPALVGRDAELAQIDRRMAALGGGRPAVLAIEGAPGLGRTRMLAASVLSAQLAGITVLRCDAADRPAEPFGLARGLVESALDVAPDEIIEAARLDADLLCHVVPALHAQLGRATLRPQEPGKLLARKQEALAGAIRRLARARGRLLLAVDDIAVADDASLALLGELATDPGGAPLGIAFAHAAGATLPGGGELLREVAERVLLHPLAADETRALLASVFGDPAELPIVARWIHELAFGNPRRAMELAQHLVDHGHARYSQGSWQLPARLEGLSLPASVEEAIDAQLDALSAPTLRVASLLALTVDSAPLSLAELTRLGEYDDALDNDAIYDAVEELGERQVAVLVGGRCRLLHAGHAEAIRRRLGDAAELHRLLALACATRGEADMVVAHHLQCAGKDDAALDRLRANLDVQDDPIQMRLLTPGRAELAHRVLRRMVEHARASGESPQVVHALLLRLNTLAAAFPVPEYFDEALRPLAHDLGLDLLAEIDPQLPQAKRLGKMLERAGARRRATPADRRGLDPISAIYAYAHTCGRMYPRGMASLDLPMLRRSASLLGALGPLATPIEVLGENVARAERGLRGVEVLDQLRRAIARLRDEPTGMDGGTQVTLLLGMRYYYAFELARRGNPTRKYIDALSARPESRDMGAAVELMLDLNQGHLERAVTSRARLRALLARGLSRLYLANLHYNEALTAELLGHVPTLKAALDPVVALSARYPGWRPVEQATRGVYHLARGEPELALEHAQAVLSQVGAGEHFAWGSAMHCALAALCELGRVEEAATGGARAVEQAEVAGLQYVTRARLEAALAHAQGRRGEGNAALEAIDRALELLERGGIDAVPRAATVAECARAALAAGARARYEALLENLQEVADRCGGEHLRATLERARGVGKLGGRVHELRVVAPGTQHGVGARTTAELAAGAVPEVGSRTTAELGMPPRGPRRSREDE